MNLREQLKEQTAPAHRELDSLPVLGKYAGAKATEEEYAHVIKSFLSFYQGVRPATKELNNRFHFYRQTYMDSLKQDIEELDVEPPASTSRPSPVNEVAFFYLLLGSSLGASRIIKNYGKTSLPIKHLVASQSEGIRLWPDFLKTINEYDDQETEIIASSIELFSKLKETLTDNT